VLHHFYAGRRQAPLAAATTEVVDPSTGHGVRPAPVATAADLDRAFASPQRLSRAGGT
jgi:acyl-CoA reductase-like NAD-dependent aldehyde dehydrogenase